MNGSPERSKLTARKQRDSVLRTPCRPPFHPERLPRRLHRGQPMRPFRPAPAWIAAAAFFLAALAAPAPAVAEEMISPDTQSELEIVINKKIDGLLAEKINDGSPYNGMQYKRGTSSYNFRRVDDNTYKTTFFVDTTQLQTLKTERYELTLKRDAGRKWAISDEKLVET